MSVTVLPVSASAPPPAAPAAEPVDAGGSFERVLAQSEAAAAPAKPANRREPADPEVAPGDEPESDGHTLAVDVGGVTFVPVPAAGAQAIAAPQPEASGEAQPAMAPPAGIGGVPHQIDGESVDGPATPGFAPASAEEPVAPGRRHQVAPVASGATGAATDASAGVHAAIERREQAAPAAVALESGLDASSTTEPRRLEPSRPIARTARPANVNDPARALAAEVLTHAADLAGSEAGRRSPGVATAPIQLTPAPAAAAAHQGSAAPSAAHEIAAFEAAPEGVVAGESAIAAGHDGSANAEPGSHESFDRHSSSTARKVADLPAPMAFPAHAAFAAAIERAQPALEPAAIAAPSREQLASVVPQVVRSVQLHLTPGGGEVTLTLEPENLGTVKIELRVDRHRVTATVAAETAAVRGWLASNEQELKSGLADLGLQLDELVVREDGRREGRSQQPDDRGTPKRRRRETAGTPLFEVHV